MIYFNRIILFVFLIAANNGLSAQLKNKYADSSLFFSNLHVGDSFYAVGRQDSARFYFRKAKDVALRDTLTGYDGFIKLNSLGVAYGKMDRLDSAYDFFKRATELNSKLHGDRKNALFANLCKNVGDYFLLRKNTDSAINRYQYAIVQLVNKFDEQDVRLNPVEFDKRTNYNDLFEALNLKARTLTLQYEEDKNKNHLVSSVYAYDAIFRLIEHIAITSTDEAKGLFSSKNFSGFQAVENCLALFNLTGDEVFLRQAFRFSEKVRMAGGNAVEIKSLQSRMPHNKVALSYVQGDTSMIVFLISNRHFRHALIKIDSNFRDRKLTTPLPKQILDSFGAQVRHTDNLVILGHGDSIETLLQNQNDSTGGTEQRYLIWIMIAAACLLGGVVCFQLLKPARSK